MQRKGTRIYIHILCIHIYLNAICIIQRTTAITTGVSFPLFSITAEGGVQSHQLIRTKNEPPGQLSLQWPNCWCPTTSLYRPPPLRTRGWPRKQRKRLGENVKSDDTTGKRAKKRKRREAANHSASRFKELAERALKAVSRHRKTA